MNTEHSKPDLAAVPRPPKVYPQLNRRLPLVIGLALVGGVIMVANGGYEYHRASTLKNEGVTTPGTLVDSNTFNTGKGRTSHRITLDYTPREGNVTYQKEFIVTEAIFLEAQRRNQLPVTYLTDDPTLSTAGNELPLPTESLAIGVGLTLFGVALWYYLRRQRAVVDRYVMGDE